MPDVFATITQAPPRALELIASALELRASISQQQEMLRTYLREIDFPDGAKVLEVGSGTGAVARVLATWPRVGEVLGVDPSPYLVERACALSPGMPNLKFAVGDGRKLDLEAASVDVVILHTVLSTATVATGDRDPLQACVEAFVEGFVNDRWMVRRMRHLAMEAGFEVAPLRSHGLMETSHPLLALTWIDRGADVLAGRGQISQEFAAALKSEATRRAESGAFFGYMAYASMVGRTSRGG
jgi:SAM-dependent methyltransferase